MVSAMRSASRVSGALDALSLERRPGVGGRAFRGRERRPHLDEAGVAYAVDGVADDGGRLRRQPRRARMLGEDASTASRMGATVRNDRSSGMRRHGWPVASVSAAKRRPISANMRGAAPWKL